MIVWARQLLRLTVGEKWDVADVVHHLNNLNASILSADH